MAVESISENTAIDLPATVIGEGEDSARDPFAEAPAGPTVPTTAQTPIVIVPEAPGTGLAFDLLVAAVLLQLILLALAAFALTPTRILAIIPGLTALLSFQRAVMVIRSTTNRITWATIIEVGGTVLVLWIAISFFDVVGAVAAAAALLIGRIGANLYLAPAMRTKR